MQISFTIDFVFKPEPGIKYYIIRWSFGFLRGENTRTGEAEKESNGDKCIETHSSEKREDRITNLSRDHIVRVNRSCISLRNINSDSRYDEQHNVRYARGGGAVMYVMCTLVPARGHRG